MKLTKQMLQELIKEELMKEAEEDIYSAKTGTAGSARVAGADVEALKKAKGKDVGIYKFIMQSIKDAISVEKYVLARDTSTKTLFNRAIEQMAANAVKAGGGGENVEDENQP